MSYAPAFPHDPIEAIAPDVFMARGSIKMNALMTITRNMAVVRHDGELTLVDPIRLSADEEKRLEGLGTIARILRLGSMHGLDDAYYMDRYGAELWAPGLSDAYPEPKATLLWDEETPLPFPDARLFKIDGVPQDDGALLLSRGKGLLLTCDAIQNYGDYSHNNLFARIMMPLIGFKKTTILGPMWIKMMTPEGGSLEGEFRRLLELEFDALLSAHGTFLPTGAHAAVTAAVDRVYAG